MEGDKTLITQSLVFTDPDALRKQTFYKYTDQALENIRRSIEAKSAQTN
jgi:hypothetical protein